MRVIIELEVQEEPTVNDVLNYIKNIGRELCFEVRDANETRIYYGDQLDTVLPNDA